MKLTILPALALVLFSTTINAQPDGVPESHMQPDSLAVQGKKDVQINAAPPRGIPTPVEMLAGSRGLFWTSVVNKQLASMPKLGFLSVASFTKEWKTSQLNDYILQAFLTYKITKGLSVMGGFNYTPVSKFRPNTGLNYSYANKDWTVVLVPRIDLTNKPNTELFGFAEYKPYINDKLRFYSKVQVLYVHSLSSGRHQRSGVNLRAGLMYREFVLGAGFNSDYYGPARINETNLGLFFTFYLF